MKAELIEEFAANLLSALGATADSAASVAESLFLADRLGCHTHGVGLLPLYASMVASGALDPLAQPAIDSDDGSCIKLDGKGGFGQLSGRLAVQTGIEKARKSGIAAVGIRNGGHLGRLGEWAQMAATGGMLFMAFCNAGGGARNVAPHGSRQRLLSTNPLAFGVPAFGAVPNDIIVDFATSQVSGSVIREHFLSGEPLDPAWAIADNGKPLTDAARFIRGDGALLPLGGQVTGHKGYALAIISEVLGGIAGGMMAGEHEPEWFSNAALFLFVDPLKFLSGEELGRRIAGLAAYLQEEGARLPGQGAYEKEEVLLRQGIDLPTHVGTALAQLAVELGVSLPAEWAESAGITDRPGDARTW